jgi:mannose-6-phosphate isomerase-like protein (cupin superfamily)
LSPRERRCGKPGAAHGTLAFAAAGPEDEPGMSFETKLGAAAPDVIAPDGSEVRVLCATVRGSMASFSLPPNRVAKAVAHRSVDELWYVAAGRGRLWRRLGEHEAVVELTPGTSLAIPVGTYFQFRCDGAETLVVIGTTMPPWPGADEAYHVDGPWTPSA